jgi:PRTRC genetic system ThiF family protein
MITSRVRIALVGLGGSGGEMLESLVRINAVLKELGHSGFELHIFDDDVVSHSNIGRTRFAQADIGQFKSDVLASRFNLFYGLDIQSHPVKFEPDLMFEYHLIVSCTDSVGFRLAMGEFINDNSYELERGDVDELLWLDLGNESHTGQFVLGHLWQAQSPVKIPNVVDLYGASLQESLVHEDRSSSCSLRQAVEIQSLFINKAVVVHASSLLYELFKEGKITSHGGFVNLQTQQLRPLKMDERVWNFMGYY